MLFRSLHRRGDRAADLALYVGHGADFRRGAERNAGDAAEGENGALIDVFFLLPPLVFAEQRVYDRGRSVNGKRRTENH